MIQGVFLCVFSHVPAKPRKPASLRNVFPSDDLGDRATGKGCVAGSVDNARAAELALRCIAVGALLRAPIDGVSTVGTDGKSVPGCGVGASNRWEELRGTSKGCDGMRGMLNRCEELCGTSNRWEELRGTSNRWDCAGAGKRGMSGRLAVTTVGTDANSTGLFGTPFFRPSEGDFAVTIVGTGVKNGVGVSELLGVRTVMSFGSSVPKSGVSASSCDLSFAVSAPASNIWLPSDLRKLRRAKGAASGTWPSRKITSPASAGLFSGANARISSSNR